ncbi:NAD-dependent epimerase/dehydratase family protein [Bacilliculturomica massiliensis]|uniref:NAD-dependent epimerase/dehydratase family protein n=1 Tax=Bacilliculturomica massiliensis TaxID=1917867 RepID=UPI001032647D|nr:NAD(P)-dependent oxidoreductase [Bacilliculturomica massiliensis]
MTNKKVLLTGGTGFIGQHCIPVLLESGFDVYASYRKTIPERYTRNVKWIKADLLHGMNNIEETMGKVGIDYLLHLAWDLTPGEYQNSGNNLKWLKASLDLIEVFIKYGGKRIVTAGTCFEYDFSDGILKEDITPLMPDTLYGECKAAMYNVTKHFCSIQGISYAHGRVFYLFGPGENKKRVVPYVITELAQGHKPRCGSGVQRLDYLYVKDVAKAFVALLDTNIQGAVNIGSGEVFSLRSFLDKIQMEMGFEDMIEFADPVCGDIKQIVANSARLRNEVGWKADYSIQSGVIEFIKWMTEKVRNLSH